MKARISGLALRYHHWFGVICCLAVLGWGASGVMHPVMSRLNPQPVNMQAPAATLDLHAARSPAEVLARAGITEVAALRVVAWEAGTFYQATLPDQGVRRYFDARSGEELHDGDARHAIALARHFTGSDAQGMPRLLTAFDADYLPVNRLLPVWRVDVAAAGQLRAYVETSPPRLAALVDERKAMLGAVFRALHSWDWDFLAGRELLRTTLMTALLATILLSALSGLWLYGLRWRTGASGRPLRRWHRTLGATVSASALAFAVSGAWHLLGSQPLVAPVAPNQRFAAADLRLPPALRHGSWNEAGVALLDGKPVWMLRTAGKRQLMASAAQEHHPPARDGTPPPAQQASYLDMSGVTMTAAETRHAIALAGGHSGLTPAWVASAEPVTRFEGEYGFLNKRLPVWRVNYATSDHAAFYVETRSGILATVVRDADRREGWSFTYLHKYHWLDAAGKDVRDVVAALFALGNVVMAIMGLWLFVIRSRLARYK